MKILPPDRLQYLLKQYAQQQCSQEELEEFFHIINQSSNKQLLQELLDQQLLTINTDDAKADIDWEFMYQKIVQTKQHRPLRRMYLAIQIAAAVLLLVGLGGLWFYRHQQKAPAQIAAASMQDALPASSKATLELADGSSVDLDSSGSKTWRQQGQASINQSPGHLVYQAGETSAAPVYNKVSTPAGGQFQLTLSDGTKVWLNTSSSIRFPVAFDDASRQVEITGEAYFEVAKVERNGKRVPFSCRVNNMEVNVLGTHFNINSYNDESAIRTTLLEGSVQIKQGNTTKMLLPGQQSSLDKSGQLTVVSQVNMDEVMGWKNGFFIFEGADLQQIMRQVSKWYNLEVVYEGKIPEVQYNGRISRNTNLSQLMKILALSGVNFRIEGSKLIIKS